MVVICPKCKAKLKVDEAKIGAEGTRFKCPKCSTVLMVRKPAAKIKKTTGPASDKVLIAHSNPVILGRISALLADRGYKVVTATDGIDVMVKALREYPFLTIVEVALPKIYGFEVCKRLKSREETKGMKFILIPSIHDTTKYRREPVSLYGADDYIEEHELESMLIKKINDLLRPAEKETSDIEDQSGPQIQTPPQQPSKEELPAKDIAPPSDKGPEDEKIEKAKRLARTIINDIYLYNSARVDTSLGNNNFYSVFASEIREGQKLYDKRIPQEIRNIHNYYREAIENFLSAKKKTLG